ncbi:nacrein-like protein [Saccostrea echinata]|uniref:nacrein-like protein n=1 Tax=Saccostrea echinata TaxID=191078 RepID=UPI002A8237AB|nr:nacrein-like protein [Saccostrea echinata]
MASLGLLVICIFSLFYIDTVHGAGYLSKRPQSMQMCYYEELKDAHFSYNRSDSNCERPENWCRIHECWTTCGSTRRQSPINLNTRKAESRKYLRFALKHLSKRVPATTFNNGHAPDFNVIVDKSDNDNNIILTNVPGRPAHKKYIFAQLHVHLGRKTKKGSEHSIDNKFYPMEAHMVFYDSIYPDIKYAKPARDGLVVIGVMLKVKKDDDDDDESDEEEEESDEGDVDNTDTDYDDQYDGWDNIEYGNEYNEENEEEYGGDAEKEYGGEVEKEYGGEVEHDYDGEDRRKRRDTHKHSYRRICSRGHYRDYVQQYIRQCYRGRERCKVRFAKTLSDIMEKYYKKVQKHEPSHEPEPKPTYKYLRCGQRPSEETIQDKCIPKNGERHHDVQVECGISPIDVLPYDQRFYTYKGSLTTPPCYETVQWIVFKCPIRVTRKAFKALQEVEDSHFEPLRILGVRRPLQQNRCDVLKNF